MPAMPYASMPAVRAVRLRDGFFGAVQQMVRSKMLPFQWEALNDRIENADKSYAIRNLRAVIGEVDAPHGGCVFQDSDLAKWIEAAAYALSLQPDPALEAQCDEVIDLIARAQMDDGYFNTYFQLTDISKRFTNLRDHHELYCTGHMLEAAIAYFEATGKNKLLNCMRRMIACISRHIGPEAGKLHGYPGHEEIELALCKLYVLTGDAQALSLAQYFIDERGKAPFFFEEEAKRRGETPRPVPGFGPQYSQAHKPVREQETLDGHSVRALYLLAGMIDVARETDDAALLAAGKRLFDNAVQKRMYITGGVGSTHIGEAFTFDYDLPPETVYAETCASIALIFAAERLMRIAPEQGVYADIIERALYNTCMAGMSLDGSSFFYVNPLEVLPEASRKNPDRQRVLPMRPPWFGCACCPPNLARLLLSLGSYQYSVQGKDIYAHLYCQGDAALAVDGQTISLAMETDYPRSGLVKLQAGTGDYRLHLHIPQWCEAFTLTRNGEALSPGQYTAKDGYVTLEGPFAADAIELDLRMTPQRIAAHPAVRDAAGCVAVSYGPVVYCLEGIDNGPDLHRVLLPDDAALRAQARPDLLGGITIITADGLRETGGMTQLYGPATAVETAPAALTFIPYATWANREENEMRVWVRRHR